MGKSRILGCIATILLLKHTSIKRCHIVFPNQLLKDRDEKILENLFKLASIEKKIKYHCDLKFKSYPGEIILIDEADEFIFTDPKLFNKATEGRKVMCLTATVDDHKEESLERALISKLGFRIYDSLDGVSASSR